MVSFASSEFYRPFIPMTLAVMAGLACGIRVPGHIGIALVMAVLLAVGMAVQLARRHPCLVLPLLFCAAAGYLSIQPWLASGLPDNHISHFADRGVWRIHGRVVEQPFEKAGRWQWVLAATRLTRSGISHDICGRVKVSGRGEFAAVSRGDLVSFHGRLRTIRNFANPGGFDYQRFMAFQGIRVRTYIRSKSFEIQDTGAGGHWLAAVDHIRGRLARQMDASLVQHSPEAVALLKVLLLGDRSRITGQMRDRFNRAGVGHVLAISGLHIGMVATITFMLVQWGMAMIPLMRRFAWTRKGAAIFSLATVAAYGLLAGLSPSTQRAMIMVAVFLARYWVGRRNDWLNALALAALVILLVHPPSLLSISFQLSFAAVLALVVGLDALSIPSPPSSSGVLPRLKVRLMGFMWVSLVAILGTLPLVALYFNQTSTMGLFTNLIVVPVVGTVVVPAGLIGMAMAFVSSAAASICWQTAAWAMEVVYRLVELVARWPWSAFKCVTPTGVEIVLYYLTACLLLFWRHISRAGVALALVAALWGMDAGYWCYQRFGHGDLRVTALDVGQGSASLLQLPGGYTVLVDGGGFSDNRLFDVGGRIIAPVLWRSKIKTIDLVVLTHPNSDHLNGLLYILEHFNVKTVWSNGEAADTFGFRSWKQLISHRRIDSPRFENLPQRSTIQGVRFEILGPSDDFMSVRASQPWRDTNNNSLVLRVEYKGISILFSGDIAAAAEADLLDRHDRQSLRSAILMSPHHGSGKSSTMAFLKAVRPGETVISCGWQNRFGFPHAKVLDRLQAVGSRIWSTAEHGAVRIVIGEHGYHIETCR